MSKLLQTLLCLCFISSIVNGQSYISGQITDSISREGVPFASVVLYGYKSTKIYSYTQSNDSGYYKLKLPEQAGVFLLKTKRLSYKEYSRQIVSVGGKNNHISLSFSLIPDIKELQEVVVKRPPPIIIKEDTIIYDIQEWTEIRDQTLEEVISKMPGFKILSDGEIQVNGKLVNKVLINGEEMSGSGAALLTKSIAPENVEKLEVRLDEKDNKIKESLLDANAFVVLDIQLKEDLKKSLFGKIRFTGGYQHKLIPGGYMNIFSLKKKFKLHVFAESDRFGEETISLDMIKFIGAEAQAKWFDEPADFQEFFNSPAIQEEVYGFHDYSKKQNDIIGVTTKYRASSALDIYFGTYNARMLVGDKRDYNQLFENGTSFQLMEENENLRYTSKNKLDFRYNKGKIKGSLNLNAVFTENMFSSFHKDSGNERYYNFDNESNSGNFYNNLLLEYAPTKQLGFQVKAAYSYEDTKYVKRLQHNDSSYANYILNENGGPVDEFEQTVLADPQNFLIDAFTQYRSDKQLFKLGLTYDHKFMAVEKIAIAQTASPSIIPLFTGPKADLSFHKTKPYLYHYANIGRFKLQNKLGWASVHFPRSIESTNQVDSFWEYELNFTYSGGNFNHFSATYNRNITPFPLAKLFRGYDIQNFQTLLIPGLHKFQPTIENTANILFGVNFSDIGLRLDPGIYYGYTENNNRYFLNDSPFVEIGYNQLSSQYVSVSFIMIQTFDKFPLHLTLEPEWLVNAATNRNELNNSKYQILTNIPSIGLKVRSVFKRSFFNFNLYPKYTAFKFSNELIANTDTQEMLAIDLVSKFNLFNEKLLLTSNMRGVQFLGNVEAEYLNIGFKVQVPMKKFNGFLLADNIFNNQVFFRQTIFPSFFINEQTAVFGRFFKIGVDYKFK